MKLTSLTSEPYFIRHRTLLHRAIFKSEGNTLHIIAYLGEPSKQMTRYQENRGCHIHRSQDITANSLAHEDAIRQIENGRENQSHQRWDKQLHKQARHVHRAEIQSVSIIFHSGQRYDFFIEYKSSIR